MAASGASRGLTPLDLDEARSLIGVPLRRTGHNRTATRPAISRWARSTGDCNPLWLDSEYGPRTSVGAHVAPPCWLFSVDDTCLAVKFPEWHVLYGGVDWEFCRWVRLGDDLTARSTLTAVEEKQGRFCGPMVLQTGETEFKDQEGRLVARAVSRVLRTGRQEAVEAGKYQGIAKTPFSSEQMLAIENDYDGEEIRGADPRCWEELAVGQELTPVVRGPLTSEEVIQFISATRPSLGFKRFIRHRRRHPGCAYWDPETGSWESWEASLVRDEAAQAFGFPFAHDVGLDRISWVGNLVTNWMGDQGFLEALSVDLTLPNFYGDVTWCRGRVSRVYTAGGGPVADLELWCENQRGQRTAEGAATVSLPSGTPILTLTTGIA